MEVTCERCSTVYDFDDALVSERGTSVKCTTCGHQFKVRRASVGATVPDTWIVRTVDGREIELSALRELQGAIYEGRVTRDDVLVRGNSRPRRLGSIAELDPFFNRMGMTVPGSGTMPPPAATQQTRSRTRTPAGLGGAPEKPAPARTEHSVAIPLPGGIRPAQQPPPPAAEPAPAPRSTPPPPMAMGASLLGKRPSQRPPTISSISQMNMAAVPAAPRVPGGLEDLNTIDAPLPPPARMPSPSSPMFPEDRAPISTRTAAAAAPPPVRAPSGSSPDAAPISNRSGSGVERISVLPPPPPPPRKPQGSSPMFPPGETPPPPPARKPQGSSPMFPPAEVPPPPPPRKPQGSSPMFPPAEVPPPPPPRKPAPSTPSVSEAGPPSGEDPTLMMDRPPPSGEDPTLMMDRPPIVQTPKPAPVKPPPPKPAASADKPASSVDVTQPSPGVSSSKPQTSSPPSVPISAPTPSAALHDEAPSTAIPTERRPAAVRWIVGVVVVGLFAFSVVTVGKKYLPTGTGAQTREDGRLSLLLEQGDKELRDGDLEAANESYAKASALSDQDLNVAVRQARLASVRADVAWLKVRLLEASDPDLLNARRELDIAVGRAKQAVERARSIAEADADVTRCRIDAARLAGDVEGARKLVATLPKAAPAAGDDLLFATLDLAEEEPVWATVIERLRSSAKSEQSLGRARSMLIYALARSGDAASAKVELDRLVAAPRPHPLATALRAFVTRSGAGSKAPAAAAEDAGAGAQGDDTLKSATEAIEKGELDKAEGLLRDLAAKTPNDAAILTAQAELASKKRDRAGAIRLYEQAIAAKKDHLPAIAGLADLRWENGERQTASTLYRRIIEKGGDASPYTRRAKERLSIFADSWGDFGGSSGGATQPTNPTGGGQTPPPPPPPPPPGDQPPGNPQ